MAFWSHSRFRGAHPTTIFMVYDVCSKPKEDFIAWLQDKRLIAGSYRCPTCGRFMVLLEDASPEGVVWKCSSVVSGVKHNVKRSIRRGTWFEHSGFTIQDVLLMTYFWYREYPHRIVQYEMQTGANRVVLDWYNFCKGACVDILLQRHGQIGGRNIKIELYECKFWKRSHNSSGKVENQWVICGLEKDSTKCFLVTVVDKSAKTLLKVIKEYVLPGTIIYSDVWKDTVLEQEIHNHLTVYHEITFRDLESCGIANATEGVWTIVKRQFPAAKRSKALFDGFIGEFMYRRILSEIQDGFEQFLMDIANVYKPHTYDQ